jgi:hypothetical protein
MLDSQPRMPTPPASGETPVASVPSSATERGLPLISKAVTPVVSLVPFDPVRAVFAAPVPSI